MRDEVLERLGDLGFSEADAHTLADHFLDAEGRGKRGHGLSRVAPPGGGPKLAGTTPLAIAIPSSDGRPVVADVSMGAVTYGDVIAGLASDEELVPFGGEQAHKAFALALGLQLLVDALVAEPGHGAVLLVARPEADPLPALRARAVGVRLPGDR